MKLSLILAPYDSGRRDHGFGKGPEALISGGLVETLTMEGHDVSVEEIGAIKGLDDREIATGFAVCKAVAEKVSAARKADRFPVVLAGNCLTACGSVAGEEADSIIWFDQHADINTPETSAHGFLDGMALATALGLCWRPMAYTIHDFRPIEPGKSMLVGARDLDPEEKVVLGSLPVIRAEMTEAAEKVAALKAKGVKRTHLHIDLDVHDPDELQVNRYALSGGPTPVQVRDAATCMARSAPIVGLTLTAYDPAFDAKSEVPPVVGHLLVDFLAAMEQA